LSSLDDLSEPDTYDIINEYLQAFIQAEESNQKGFDVERNVKYKKALWGNKLDLKVKLKLIMSFDHIDQTVRET
jgi:hypothetical protein